MVSWNCKFNLKVLPSYYYFLFYQHCQRLLKWTDSLLYNSKPNLAEMFSMRSYTRVVTFVQIRQKTWPPCDFENSDWSRTFFSRTAEGIELKSGIYVPMNVFNMCCYCLRHLKIQNGHQRRSKFALKPYGKQHFHFFLENSRTEFNQTWQRCFL